MIYNTSKMLFLLRCTWYLYGFYRLIPKIAQLEGWQDLSHGFFWVKRYICLMVQPQIVNVRSIFSVGVVSLEVRVWDTISPRWDFQVVKRVGININNGDMSIKWKLLAKVRTLRLRTMGPNREGCLFTVISCDKWLLVIRNSNLDPGPKNSSCIVAFSKKHHN